MWDFRVQLPPGVRAEELERAAAELSNDYPVKEEAWLVEGTFAFSSEAGSAVSSSARRPNGYFFRSRDGKQFAQFRLDGFTFNRLAPYTSWDELTPEAFRLWEVYRKIARLQTLHRIAVRFINRIAVPAPASELDDLLTGVPRIPADLPQLMAGFFSSVVVPLSMPNTHAAIVQAMGLPPAESSTTILLDIDVFRTEELDPAPDSLRPLFDEFRFFKNSAFFGSLTEQAVRAFE
jgi:uncharacterized protein (TIGR04255 family)